MSRRPQISLRARARTLVTALPIGARLAVAAIALPGAGLGAVAAVSPSPAQASAFQISIMNDDDRLVYRNDRTRDHALSVMKTLGVQTVRVTLLWSNVAQGTRSSNPARYPTRNWDRYDKLVQACRRLGIQVYFDVTGPGPPSSHGVAPASDRRVAATWMPKATEFYKFVAYVGRRYSGKFKNRLHQVLPRVSMWSLWNEPNQGGWLTPQFYHGIPYSPILYRSLYLYGRKALDDSGHRNDFVMAGETAPLGSGGHSTRSAMYPKVFIRELFCESPSGQAYTGAAAAARNCSLLRRFGNTLRMSAWAHHPYSKRLAPTHRDPSSQALTIANLGELPKLLDDVASSTGHLASGTYVMSTEFGYETNPPDPRNGISLDRQAEYINYGDFLAFQEPRVLGQTQFQLYDAAPQTKYPKNSRQYWFTYQAGLLYNNGRPKPSFNDYQLPFVVFPAGTNPATGKHQVGVWGQLRFRSKPLPMLPPDYVQIEFRPSGSKSWRALGAPTLVSNYFGTDPEAFFEDTRDLPGPGTLRAHWRSKLRPHNRVSREVPVR